MGRFNRIAKFISYFFSFLNCPIFLRMKERKIILGVEGKDKNVIVLSPPLCFTTDNARYIVQHFSEVLANIESEAAR